MDFRIQLTPELANLLAARGVPREVKGSVTSNLEYMLALEYGHSGQSPRGWVRRNRDAYARLLRGEVEHALGVYQGDPIRGVYGGVTFGVLGILRQVVDGTPGDAEAPTGTPVDTGRAKGSWIARFPKGGPRAPGLGDPHRQAPEVTAAQQRAILRERRTQA